MMTNNRNIVVLDTLSIHAEPAKTCQISYSELVKRSGYGKTTVIRSIQELILMGKIAKINEKSKENRYQILDGSSPTHQARLGEVNKTELPQQIQQTLPS
jgi:predicted transcriptional regulator